MQENMQYVKPPHPYLTPGSHLSVSMAPIVVLEQLKKKQTPLTVRDANWSRTKSLLAAHSNNWHAYSSGAENNFTKKKVTSSSADWNYSKPLRTVSVSNKRNPGLYIYIFMGMGRAASCLGTDRLWCNHMIFSVDAGPEGQPEKQKPHTNSKK